MMMQRPVISGDSETVREALNDKEHLYLVDRGNPKALAEGILALEADPALRERITHLAYERVQENTIAGTGKRTKTVLENIFNTKTRRFY
jgi:glycosyltransferase involved in cell wall biosynthesis